MKKRKIFIITGTRADYGLLYPIITEIEKRTRLQLVIAAVGMHFAKEHGRSVNEMKKDGIKIDYEIPNRKSPSMAFDVANFQMKFAEIFSKEKPDLVFLFGDRGEMLAAAVSAIYSNIPVVHYHGGDISGNIDDSVRHAITKLSHYHFASNQNSADRLRKLGEAADRIFVVGHTAWDNIKNKLIASKEIAKKYNVPLNSPLIMILQHSVVAEEKASKVQMIETLEAVKKINENTIVIFPNSDKGGSSIIEAIEKYRGTQNFHMYKNLPHFDYLSLLQIASILVGNSSSGIVEAAFFGLPVVNIGSRQRGRYRGANVIDAPHDRDKIYSAIKKGLKLKSSLSGKNSYPFMKKGAVSKRIVDLLEKLELSQKILDKQLTY